MNTTQSFTRSIVFLAAWTAVVTTSARADDRTTSPEKEQALIAVLRSEASPAEKAIACKKLAIDGSSEAVPELAKLLSDPQLSSWARIALEAMPGKDADKALRDAADSLDGKLLVGMINSIGVRRDAEAVDSLTTRLQDKNAESYNLSGGVMDEWITSVKKGQDQFRKLVDENFKRAETHLNSISDKDGKGK